MEIRVPEVGESVREALLAKWHKKNGDRVTRDETLCELETDKITLEIHAEISGTLSILVAEGGVIPVGAVLALLEEQPAVASGVSAETVSSPVASTPSARREMREQGIDPAMVVGSGKGGRIMPDDLPGAAHSRHVSSREIVPADIPASPQAAPASPSYPVVVSAPAVPEMPDGAVRTEEAPAYAADREERHPLSPMRKRIAERLVTARRETAMLTTFNEADLSRINGLRTAYRDHFQQRHGVKLGFMSFFVKACVEALREFPAVNASIEGDDIVFHHYYDIGVAIGGDKGLVVPVLRNAGRLHLHEVEQAIRDFGDKVRSNRLTISDLEGGTFTISNGGVYGSMLSTPILNPPQSAVLGMHAIQDRPVVRDGQIVIRPMMYLALSYDHRIIDGREAVGFLKRVKEYIENPEELLLEM